MSVPLLSVDLASLMAIFRSNDLSKAVQVEDWAVLIKKAGKALLDPRLASLSAGALLDEATISAQIKPVFTTEIQLDDARGRLLLACTKAWNSLYKRWNRLVRTPFCDKSCWWFPHLSSKEGDGAVIPARERQQQQQQVDDDDSNEDDISDDDDSMEIDHDGDQPMSAAMDALADAF
jgi:hypothetical protein